MPETVATLAEVLAKHWTNNCWWHCDGGTAMSPATHAQHQAEMWREACTIRTVEQLDALPNHVVVLSADTWAWTRIDEDGYSPGEWWFPAGGEVGSSSDRIELPALLLWHPDWSRP